jgi:ribokinase
MFELVNLGSLCIDNVYGVPSIARAGETLSAISQARFAGGKGLNQSLAAARAGCRVAHVGCIGDDGGLLLEALREGPVDTSGVRRVEGVPSGHAVLQVDPAGRNAIVIVGGANRCVAEVDLDRAFSLLAPGGWLLLQNEINDLERVLARARDRNVRVAMNVAPADGRESGYDLGAMSLLIVNGLEAEALSGEATPARAVDVLTSRQPELDVVLTRGHEGLVWGRGRERLSLGAFRVDAVDETAAGDAFTGFLLAAWIRGMARLDALVYASAAGALAVTRAGAAPSIPTAAAVDRFVAERRLELA